MSDHGDSDVQVFLTSKQYTRILSIQKESKKQHQEFRLQRLQYQKDLQSYKKEIIVYESVVKQKEQEIDSLTMECLRLKKVRIGNEDEIRNFKEEQLRIKENNLTQLEQSVRENKEMKEKVISDESVIMELKAEISRITRENSTSTQQMGQSLERLEKMSEGLKKENEKLNKQLQYSLMSTENLNQQMKQKQLKLKNLTHSNQLFEKQIQRLELQNEQLTLKCQDKQVTLENINQTYQCQLKKALYDYNEVILVKDQQISNLKKQIQKVNVLLAEVNEKMVKPLESAKEVPCVKGSSKKENQKIGLRILQAFEWTKEGILNPNELKQQIQNILTLEREYQDIISQNATTIMKHEQQLSSLKDQNKKLISTLEKYKQKLARFSHIVDDLTQLKVGNDENTVGSENFALKSQIQLLRNKLNKVTIEFDQSVTTFNYEIGDMKLKYYKDMAGYVELKNEIEAIKLQHEFLIHEIEQAIDNFRIKLEEMRKDNQYQYHSLAQLVKRLKQLMPKFRYE